MYKKNTGMMESFSMFCFAAWAIFSNIIGIGALRNVHVVVPQVVNRFDTVTLNCKFDLESDPLYTVKWYKGRDEIFRYVPKETPDKMRFELPGTDVDLEQSTKNQMILRNLTPEASGRYKCEVSTDAPNFESMMESAFMYVVDIPDGRLMDLRVDKMDDRNGHVIRANCTSPPSFPPMNVTWFLNGIKIQPQMTTMLGPNTIHPKGKKVALATRSYLETELDETFQNLPTSKLIRIQCIASLFHLYRSEKVEYVEDTRPKPSSITFGIHQEQTSDTIEMDWPLLWTDKAKFSRIYDEFLINVIKKIVSQSF